MPEVIDSFEDIGAHKSHVDNECSDICDLCWMDTPFTSEELIILNENDKLILWD